MDRFVEIYYPTNCVYAASCERSFSELKLTMSDHYESGRAF